MKKYIIVGAGLAGCTAAHILSQKGYDVYVFETRNHVAGNCYDEKIYGNIVHKYGGHIFHTNNEYVWDFVNQIMPFFFINHTVTARTEKGLYSIPLNKKYIDTYGYPTEEEYTDLVLKNYSEKQWGVPFNEIPKSILSRVPKIKETYDSYFFQDKYIGLPVYGYTEFCKALLDSKNITTYIGCGEKEWSRLANVYRQAKILYTGSLDTFFDYKYGALKYRSLLFEWFFDSDIDTHIALPVINYCDTNTGPTRRICHAFFHPQWRDLHMDVYSEEYPIDWHRGMVRMYPWFDVKNYNLWNKYKNELPKNVLPLGRLGTYKYMNMDQVIAQVMTTLSEGDSL